jgi:ubiquinone/menaquinone biosynthesis C-methylase UbiE
MWSPIIRPMAQPLFKRIDLGKAQTVLDIGTGTGAMLPDIHAVVNDALIVGLDRSEGMLRHARRTDFNTVRHSAFALDRLTLHFSSSCSFTFRIRSPD